MKPWNQAAFDRIRELMAARLAAETGKRPERAGRFLEAEIDAMHEAVNGSRRQHALPPVMRWRIERLDDMATGADWGAKFALYCAELAVGAEEYE